MSTVARNVDQIGLPPSHSGRRPLGWWKCPTKCNIDAILPKPQESRPRPLATMNLWDRIKRFWRDTNQITATLRHLEQSSPPHSGHFNVRAGDLSPGEWRFETHSWIITNSASSQPTQNLDLQASLERLELHTEDSARKLADTLGWRVLGLVAFGPLGALGGMLVGGKDKKVMFAGYFKDGRKFLATTDAKTWKCS